MDVEGLRKRLLTYQTCSILRWVLGIGVDTHVKIHQAAHLTSVCFAASM